MNQITLPLRKSYFEDYLRWFFKSPSGPIVISKRNNLGKFICIHASESPIPVNNQGTVLQLPERNDKFIYFSEDVVEIINNMIEIYFDNDFREFCIIGQELNMKRKAVYEAFMELRDIKNSSEIYDMIKKRDYRRRKNLEQVLIDTMKTSANQT
jgi:TnpA family transposase